MPMAKFTMSIPEIVLVTIYTLVFLAFLGG